MSETNKGFMASLDEWTDKAVLLPLLDALQSGSSVGVNAAQDQIRKAIRTKVLESYRNGQAAGATVKQRQYARR
jgi:hypothetical protein